MTVLKIDTKEMGHNCPLVVAVIYIFLQTTTNNGSFNAKAPEDQIGKLPQINLNKKSKLSASLNLGIW